MAYITSDIVAKVQQRIRDTSYVAAEIKNYLNDTQNDLFNEYDLTFMKASQSYTMTAGDSDITHGSGLPTDYQIAIKLINTTAGQEADILYVDEEDLDEFYPDHADTTLWPNGQPLCYFHDGSTLRLFPAPAGAYTVRLRYRKRPTLLSADSSVPSIPSEFEELLVVGAAYRILQIKDNYDQAGVFENKFVELSQKLVNRYSRPQSGQVQVMPINRAGATAGNLPNSWNRTRR
jgi:hypothetical protein